MLKKVVLASAILAVCSTTVFATGTPYIGAGLGVVNNTSSTNNYRGMTANIAAGYGAIMNQSFYLGGEVLGTAFTSTLDNNGQGNSLRTTSGYGASIIPGVMLSDHTMAFARAGVVRSRFTNLSASSTGGQVGLGLQTSLTQNWDVRTEYDYTDYRSVRGTSPVSDQFNLGFVYKFQ